MSEQFEKFWNGRSMDPNRAKEAADAFNAGISAALAYLESNRQRFRSGPTGDMMVKDIQALKIGKVE